MTSMPVRSEFPRSAAVNPRTTRLMWPMRPASRSAVKRKSERSSNGDMALVMSKWGKVSTSTMRPKAASGDRPSMTAVATPVPGSTHARRVSTTTDSMASNLICA